MTKQTIEEKRFRFESSNPFRSLHEDRPEESLGAGKTQKMEEKKAKITQDGSLWHCLVVFLLFLSPALRSILPAETEREGGV
mmetsp:Transcript_55514/g.108702  ORF Transcript_55514/g.108702 Transcript_55514/m.108702 type:complete len:82 (-) Transcript_55514:1383-1628(-)